MDAECGERASVQVGGVVSCLQGLAGQGPRLRGLFTLDVRERRWPERMAEPFRA